MVEPGQGARAASPTDAGPAEARRPTSIRRLVLVPLVPLGVAVALFLGLVPTRMNDLSEEAAQRRVVGVARVLAGPIQAAIEQGERDQAGRTLALLASQGDAEAALVLDPAGRQFASWPPGEPSRSAPLVHVVEFGRSAEGLEARVPLVGSGGRRGTVAVWFSTAALDDQQRGTWTLAILVSLVVMAGGGTFAVFTARFMVRRARSERALAEEAAKFRALVEGMPDALVIHREGELVYSNEAAQALFDLEVRGGGAARTGRAALTDASSGDHSRSLELAAVDGAVINLELHSFSLQLDGAAAMIALARDVTERKQLHERLALADRMASLGTLAAGVAHEINNPLTYILSNLDFVATEIAALPAGGGAGADPAALAEVRVAIEDARGGAGRVQRIVQDMKKLARGETGERTAVDVRRPLESAAKMLSEQIRRRAILELDLEAVPPVRASESQLMQVFINLLGNAADALGADASGAAAPPGGHRITVKTRMVPSSGCVEIEVRDTGSGIPPEVRDKIFDAFFTTKPVGVGTGLGLSISHTIVTAMGGTLTCDSALGAGTTMRVRLPSAPIGAIRPRPVAIAAGGARILVVDDDATVAESAARLLDDHRVAIETSPTRALERLRDGERFDLVLCDVWMPGMTGPQLRAALQASHPDQTGAMVFMSGANEVSDEAALLALGVPILAKPFDRANLHDFVAAQIARRQTS